MQRSTLFAWLTVPLAAAAGFVSRSERVPGPIIQPVPAAPQVRFPALTSASIHAESRNLFEAVTSRPAESDKYLFESGKLQSLLRPWVAQDPQAAVDWALSFPEPQRSKVLLSTLSVIASLRPEEILQWLPLVKDERQGNATHSRGAGGIVTEAVRSMLAKDPRAAVAWLRGAWADLAKNSFQARSAITGELGEAVKAGRISVMDAYEAMPPGQSWTMQDLWEHLPVARLSETAEWLKNSPDKARRELLGSLVSQWTQSNSREAVAFVQTIEDTPLKDSLLDRLSSGPGLFEIVPMERRATLLAARLKDVSNWDQPGDEFPGEKFAPLVESLTASPAASEAAINLAGQWGVSDPLRALEWSARLPDIALRASTTQAAVSGWAKEDAWGASQWVLQQPAGDLRDAAAGSLVNVLASEEPDSAWKWAGDISSPAARLSARADVIRHWHTANADAADAAVSTLSPAEQEALHAAVPLSSK